MYRGNSPSRGWSRSPQNASNERNMSPRWVHRGDGPRAAHRGSPYSPNNNLHFQRPNFSTPNRGSNDFIRLDSSPSPVVNQTRFSTPHHNRYSNDGFQPYNQNRRGGRNSFGTSPYNSNYNQNRRQSDFVKRSNQDISAYIDKSMLEDPWKDLEEKKKNQIDVNESLDIPCKA